MSSVSILVKISIPQNLIFMSGPELQLIVPLQLHLFSPTPSGGVPPCLNKRWSTRNVSVFDW